MADLYAENSLNRAVEAGTKAAQLGLKGNFDVHCRDAALKCCLEANAVLSGHDHPDVKFSLPPNAKPEDVAKDMQHTAATLQAAIPKTGPGEEPAELSPEMVTLLLQLTMGAKYLWEMFFSK